MLMKYGVVTVDALVDDLTNWCAMYAAGRLHKPVLAFDGLGDGGE